MIKLGVDGRLLQGDLTGVGKYVLNLLLYVLENDRNIKIVVFTSRNVSPQISNAGFFVIKDKDTFSKVKPMIWSKFLSSRLINKEKLDIYFSGDGFLPFFLKVKKIVSVVHDLNHILVPDTMSTLHLITNRLFFKRDISKATYLIANSYATAEKFKHYYSRNIDVVIHPVIDKWYKVIDKTTVDKKLGFIDINYPYILTVATREPRKNLIKTINAFVSLKKKKLLPLHKLILVGSVGWKSNNLQSVIDSNEDVISLGYVRDDMMPYLYNGADLFVFPSKYEGFGIPPREALLCGAKVVVSDIPELREATYNLGSYLDPENQDDFENLILENLNKSSPSVSATTTFPADNDQIAKLLPLFYK
jgi:glycosyltransferase involved in cell wall biosynthesis